MIACSGGDALTGWFIGFGDYEVEEVGYYAGLWPDRGAHYVPGPAGRNVRQWDNCERAALQFAGDRITGEE